MILIFSSLHKPRVRNALKIPRKRSPHSGALRDDLDLVTAADTTVPARPAGHRQRSALTVNPPPARIAATAARTWAGCAHYGGCGADAGEWVAGWAGGCRRWI